MSLVLPDVSCLVYLGSVQARRKRRRPRPAGITSPSFLNVFQHFSSTPRSVCSLELPDGMRPFSAQVQLAHSRHLRLRWAGLGQPQEQCGRRRRYHQHGRPRSGRPCWCSGPTSHAACSQWKVLGADDKQAGKSICGSLAINKAMQGKSCSCCLLLVPGFPPPTPPRHVMWKNWKAVSRTVPSRHAQTRSYVQALYFLKVQSSPTPKTNLSGALSFLFFQFLGREADDRKLPCLD